MGGKNFRKLGSGEGRWGFFQVSGKVDFSQFF